MKHQYRHPHILWIFGFLFYIILSTNVQAITGVEILGPYKHNKESWTLTVGGQNNDKGLVSYTDPNSGEIFWGLTSELSGNTYGIIIRTARNGSVLWTYDIKDFAAMYYVKPQNMLISNDGKILYIVLLYANDTNGNQIGMLELYAQNGTMAGFSFLLIKTGEASESNSVMDWITDERILIATDQRREPYGSDCFLIIYNTLIHNSSNWYKINSGVLYNIPKSLECKGIDSKNILSVYARDSGGVPSTWLYAINYTDGKLGINLEKQIVLDSPNYQPIRAISYGTHIYLTMIYNNLYCIVSLNSNFVMEFFTQWNLAEVSWKDMVIDTNGLIILAGYGKQTFNLESYIETQGILITYDINPAGDKFVIVELNRFGEPDTPDAFIGLELSTKGELFIAGYGRSYGRAPAGDDDAYLIKWRTVADACPTCDPSIINIDNINWQVILVITVIGCVTIIITITSIINYRKTKTQ